MLGTKEFYEVVQTFEKEFKGEFRMDREDKEYWQKGNVYQNGDANQAFKAYLRGFALGKAMSRD